jgi:hypothetical protein
MPTKLAGTKYTLGDDFRVDRSVVSMASPVSVRTFGAKGDGVTDDTEAFTAAGNSAAVVEVRIPAGTYRLDSNPSPTGSVTWVVEKGASFTGNGTLSAVSNKIVSLGAYRSIESSSSFYNGIFGYLEQNAALTGYGTLGLHGYARSAGGAGTAGEADIAVSAFALHDLAGSSGSVYGLYTTAIRASGVNGYTHGMEVDVANMGSTVAAYPAAVFPAGLTAGIWLATGGETTEPSAGGSPGTASVGLAIVQNDAQAVKTAKFGVGLLFHNTAIAGADGTGGANLGIAVAFAAGHSMVWFNNSNQACAEITSSGADVSLMNLRMDFANYGVIFANRGTGVSQFVIGYQGEIDFANTTKSASAGAADGYMTIKVQGTAYKVPLYATA